MAVYGKYNDGEKPPEEQKNSEKKRIKAFLGLNLPIVYMNYGGYYGFSTEEINSCIDNGKDVVIISSDICAIRDLKSIYGDNCIPCYIHRNNLESEDKYIEIAKSRNDTIESAKLRYQIARDIFERILKI